MAPGWTAADLLLVRAGKIRRENKVAYLDGRPTEEMIDQSDHWDHVGVWAAAGRQYYFDSGPCHGEKSCLHLYDLETRQIIHAPRQGWLPRWSRDGNTTAWARWKDLRSFELWQNFE